MEKIKIVLSIAGSDSGAGAGIQADLKTISALGAYATTVITAITAQNTQGVRSFYPVSAQALREQLEAIGDDMEIDAVKIGMIPCLEHVEVIRKAIDKYAWKEVVLDPVMVATSGDMLVKMPVVEAMLSVLFPVSRVITPNLIETESICGIKVKTEDDMKQAAVEILEMGCNAVLIKGGHLEGDNMVDLLAEKKSADSQLVENHCFCKFSYPKIDTRNLHGTGCTLSSAIATFLAGSHDLKHSVENAKKYISRAIEGGAVQHIGKGNGPVDHFVDYFIDYASICK